MKFVTFQPLKVKETLEKEGVYEAKGNNSLEDKIFCLKIDKDIMERVYLSAPSMPQIMVIFESNEFKEIDSIARVNKLFLGIDTPSTSKYKEYTVDKIEACSVKSIKVLSTSSDVDIVQDVFIGSHLEELEKVSGYKWKRGEDLKESWWSSSEGIDVVFALTQCMIPSFELDEYFYDNAVSLIRKHFIKK